jgi:hypothetical protein
LEKEAKVETEVIAKRLEQLVLVVVLLHLLDGERKIMEQLVEVVVVVPDALVFGDTDEEEGEEESVYG